MATKQQTKKPEVVSKPSINEFEIKDRLYLLKGNETPVTFMLQTKHTQNKPLLYFDGRSNRALRWSDNQSSPFLDEQDGYAICPPIIFEEGKLLVSKENVELQKFLSFYHPARNVKYYEFDAEEVASEEYDAMAIQLDAQISVKEMPIEDLEAIARVVLKSKVDRMTSSEIRRDMLLFARNNPKELMSLVNDESLKLRNIAIRAVDMGILEISNDGRNVSFGNKGPKVITVPFGENVYSALAAFFMTDEGMDVLANISNKL